MNTVKSCVSIFVVFFCASVNALEKGSVIHIPEHVIEKAITNLKQESKATQETIADTALLEEAFVHAPKEIKKIIAAMKAGEKHAYWFNTMLLAGPTGTGKSTLAQAIAHNLGRKAVVISAPTLLGRYRDQATENVRNFFEDKVNRTSGAVVIIDEINALTDGYTSEHADTHHTAMQLWTLLDEYQKNPNFLFIGTTNTTKKMPHQLQSRFKGKTFFVDVPVLESRNRSLKYVISSLGIDRDASCDDAYLSSLAQKSTDFSMRDVEVLVRTALLFGEGESGMAKTVSKASLEWAYEKIKKENEKLWDFSEHVLAEEKRHQESLGQSKKQSEESMAFQLKLAEWQTFTQSLIKERQNWHDAKIPLTKVAQIIEEAHKLIFPDKNPESEYKIIKSQSRWSNDKEVVVHRDNPSSKT